MPFAGITTKGNTSIPLLFAEAINVISVSDWVVKVAKNGGAYVSATGTVLERVIDTANGQSNYYLIPSAGDVDTAGSLVIKAESVTVSIGVSANATVIAQDVTDAARFGLTSIPNAMPGAAGGLTIAGSNAATTFATLTVSGATSLAALSTSGTVTFNALTVTNATTLSGAVSLGSTLATTGTVTFSAFTITNAFTISGTKPAVNATLIGGVVPLIDANGRLQISGVELDSGTAQSGSSTGIVLQSGHGKASFAHKVIVITSGTGVGQVNAITSISTDTCVVPTWTTNPDNTSKYSVLAITPLTTGQVGALVGTLP